MITDDTNNENEVSPFNTYMGIILYNIEANGCLNGVYTNLGVDGEIYSETCRKRKWDGVLVGDYDCIWFDIDNEKICDVTLAIRLYKNKAQTFTFLWVGDDKKVRFRGIGYQMNDKQIALSYWR